MSADGSGECDVLAEVLVVERVVEAVVDAVGVGCVPRTSQRPSTLVGSHLPSWFSACSPYGEHWNLGDIVSCTITLKESVTQKPSLAGAKFRSSPFLDQPRATPITCSKSSNTAAPSVTVVAKGLPSRYSTSSTR
jgi:hypothetical protein